MQRINKQQPEGVEGKDYEIIYDHDGKLVKYWYNSHLIQPIKEG